MGIGGRINNRCYLTSRLASAKQYRFPNHLFIVQRLLSKIANRGGLGQYHSLQILKSGRPVSLNDIEIQCLQEMRIESSLFKLPCPSPYQPLVPELQLGTCPVPSLPTAPAITSNQNIIALALLAFEPRQ